MPRKGRGAICFTNGNVTEYVYSASGQKLRVKHYTAVPNITRPLGVQPPELTAGQILHTDVTDYLLGGRVAMRGGRVTTRCSLRAVSSWDVAHEMSLALLAGKALF